MIVVLIELVQVVVSNEFDPNSDRKETFRIFENDVILERYKVILKFQFADVECSQSTQ